MLNLNDDENENEYSNNNNSNNNNDLVNILNKISSNSKPKQQQHTLYDSMDDTTNFVINNNMNYDTDLIYNKNSDYLEQRFMDDNLENPFLIDKKKQGLRKLFLNSESDTGSFENEFNSDTRIQALGGLSLWQFTAILISVLMFIGNLLLLITVTGVY